MSAGFANPDPPSLRDALQCLQSGQAARAETLARQALAVGPDDARWLSVHALALSALARNAEALPLYERLASQQPQVAAHWSNLGNCLCELRREREAREPLARALALGADDVAVHFAMARACHALGDASSGLRHIERALGMAPDDVEFRLLHARLLGDLDEWDAAKAELGALQQQRLEAPLRTDIGYLLLRAGAPADARQLFEAVLEDDPAQTDARIGMVLALERLNRLDAAVMERAALDAQLGPAAKARLHDKLLQLDARLAARRGDHARACEVLEQLLVLPDLDADTRISLGFDLGAALVKCGQVDAAMAAFAQAHALRRAQVNARHTALARGDSLYDVLDEPLPDSAPAALRFDDARTDPVFVVGFPRSGTTLLEQLLDAHEGLASFDEQPFVQQLARQLYTRGDTIQAALRTLGQADRQRLRDGYFAEVASVLPATAALRRPVDKNPLNLLRLPLLPHLFPDAQAVLVVRHPCDVVLSCYMQHFGAPAFAVTFETLESCADMYHRTFAGWLRMRDRLAMPVHLLRYEDLVDDTEREARALLAFLGLEWQPQLLQFTEHARRKGVIGTPSYTQVIEPVNSRSVGRWLAYRRYFSDAALDKLAPWVAYFGYPPLP